jgi:murein DD-endopeptidase MepM/ murein hydrolase activator NlpD
MTSVMKACTVVIVLAFLVSTSFAQRGSTRGRTALSSGGGAAPEILDTISDETRAEIEESSRQNIETLGKAGRLMEAAVQPVTFRWPMRQAGLNNFFIEGISNYVDQNQNFPNQLLDWNCGARSYDVSSGYNHRGADIFTWPFGWYMMDNGQAEIVAAAAGTIINRSDGNFDRNCAMNNANANYVIVLHADGTRAWYWHMKNGSVTPKQVGDNVEVGEYLGVVGSSGSSTGPHLHFEIYNSSNQLQDPYTGACNSLNAFTYWANQEPYRNSRINALQTGSAPAQAPACPTQEVPNIDYTLSPGSVGYFSAFYRDQMVNDVTQYQLLRPDGTVFQSWSGTSTQTYSASWWWWSWSLPAAPTGTWTFRATCNGVTYDRKFALGTPNPSLVTVSGRVTSRSGRGISNAVVTLTNATTGAIRTTTTTRNGSYSFSSVAATETYNVSIAQSRYVFGNATRTLMPVANTSGVDIVAH